MTLGQDLRYTARTLLKSPGFTAVASLSLALGIGANTAIFSLIDEVVLKMLPVAHPEQLVAVRHTLSRGGTGGSFSQPTYRLLRDQSRTLAAIFAFDGSTDVIARIDGVAEPVRADIVSGSYFDALGVGVNLGRAIGVGDDRPGRPPVAVISDGFWRRRFSRSISVIGRSLDIKGMSFTIVGVAPGRFFGTRVVPPAPDLWVPMFVHDHLALKDNTDVGIMARLQPGIPAGKASAELTLIYQQGLAEDASTSPPPDRLKEIHAQRIELRPAGRGGLREFSQQLQILVIVVGLVLLIACANVASLLLARCTGRQQEIAIRLAIGAGRRRLVRQLLTESVLLAVLGGALGLLFAWWAGDLLFAWMGREHPSIPPDALILAFTAVMALLTGILFGLAPAFRATGVDLIGVLKENARSFAARRGRLQLGKALIVCQMVLSLVLLIGAGLFLRTLGKLHQVNLGYERDHVLVPWVLPTLVGYEGPKELQLYQNLLDRLNGLPGVRSASLSRMSLLFGYWGRRASVPGVPPVTGGRMEVAFNAIAPRFFETMGITLLGGREFSRDDGATAPRVAIVGEETARQYFPGQSPIGRQLHFGDPDSAGNVEIVGVVRDIKIVSVKSDSRFSTRAVYVPFTQAPPMMMGQMQFKIRTIGSPRQLVETVRRAILAIDPELPLRDVETQADLVDESLGEEHSMAMLLSFFGVLATLLASIGLYGTMAYAVSRRTREIGLRLALGASRRDVQRMVLRESLALVLVGAAFGIPAALAGGRLISSLLFGVSPSDPLTLLLATLLLIAVAALASWVPARQASRLEAMTALRYE
jgi:predicted permease